MKIVSLSIFGFLFLHLVTLLAAILRPSPPEGPNLPASLLRTSTPVCPCKCFTAKSNLGDLCLNSPPECALVRCQPHTFGFACCHPDNRSSRSASQSSSSTHFTTRSAIRQSGQSFIERDVRTIERESKAAAEANPRLTREASRILNRCETEIRLIQDSAGRESSSNQIDSVRSTIRIIGFQRIAEVSRKTLHFVATSLTNHLRALSK